jgi:hypothetical protein
VYAALLRLYPGGFRRTYGPDIVQVFGDQLRDRGGRRTWSRTLLDLAVTVPRYRLEAFMQPGPDRRATLVLVAGLVIAAIAGLTVVGPVAAIPLAVVAVIVALTQRTALATALTLPIEHSAARRATLTWLLAAFALIGLGMLVILMSGLGGIRWVIANVFGAAGLVALAVAVVRALVPVLRRPLSDGR